MIPPAVMHVLITMALLFGMTLAPVMPEPMPEAMTAQAVLDAWEPDPSDVALISRTIWGETRGCPVEEQRAQAWCILNRVDSPDPIFPDTIEAVVTAPNQFQCYSVKNPDAPFYEMAREILILWHDGIREIPADMCWCEGRNGQQIFRNSWERTSETRYWP